MKILDEKLRLKDIQFDLKFSLAYNTSRINSFGCELCFVGKEIICVVSDYEMEIRGGNLLDKLVEKPAPFEPWSIEVSEVAQCKRYGLLGLLIILNDGTEIRFSNAGRKKRQGISDAIEERKK